MSVQVQRVQRGPCSACACAAQLRPFRPPNSRCLGHTDHGEPVELGGRFIADAYMFSQKKNGAHDPRHLPVALGNASFACSVESRMQRSTGPAPKFIPRSCVARYLARRPWTWSGRSRRRRGRLGPCPCHSASSSITLSRGDELHCTAILSAPRVYRFGHVAEVRFPQLPMMRFLCSASTLHASVSRPHGCELELGFGGPPSSNAWLSMNSCYHRSGWQLHGPFASTSMNAPHMSILVA